jgi:hypothetical protein
MTMYYHRIGELARPRYHQSRQRGDKTMPSTSAEPTDRPVIKANAKEPMTHEQALEQIRKRAAVDLWPTVGLALGLSRGSVYEAAIRGEIEVLTYGRRKKAVTAPLRRKLGMEAV